MKNEPKKENQIALTNDSINLPAEINDQLLDLCNAGFENIDSTDIKIPYVFIVQALSQCKQEESEIYIADTKDGDIVLSSPLKKFEGKQGVNFILCGVDKNYPEFAGDETNKTLVKLHKDKSILDKCIRDTKTNKGFFIAEGEGAGNEVLPTTILYVLIENEDKTLTRASIILRKARLGAGKNLLTLVANQPKVKHPKTGNLLNLPIFTFMYKLSTKKEASKSDASKKYFNYAFTSVGQVSNEQFKQGKAFYEDYKANILSVHLDLQEDKENKTEIDASDIL